jgi:hypothetical protein
VTEDDGRIGYISHTARGPDHFAALLRFVGDASKVPANGPIDPKALESRPLRDVVAESAMREGDDHASLLTFP